MLIFYYKQKSGGVRYTDGKARQWLNSRRIKYLAKPIELITREELLHILQVSDEGFRDILSFRSLTYIMLEKQGLFQENMPMSDWIEIILKNPSILRTPLIVDETKMQVGYNEETIRRFVSRKVREVEKKNWMKGCGAIL